MADVPPTDDQLIAFLRVLAEHDGVAAHAADAMGISASAGRRWVKLAKTRGLTGKELTAEAKLRIALANANRDLKAAQREADTAERIRTEIYNLAARTPRWPRGSGLCPHEALAGGAARRRPRTGRRSAGSVARASPSLHRSIHPLPNPARARARHRSASVHRGQRAD